MVVQNLKTATEGEVKKPTHSDRQTRCVFDDGDFKQPWGLGSMPAIPQAIRSPIPMTISEALKESCNIHAKAFGIVYLDDDGRIRCETSPALASWKDAIFSAKFRDDFCNIVKEEQQKTDFQTARRGPHRKGAVKNRPCAEASVKRSRRTHKSVPSLAQQGRGSSMARRMSVFEQSPQMSTSWSPCSTSCSIISGPREIIACEGPVDNEAEEYVGAPIVTKNINIADEAELVKFYDTRFRQIQQVHCKTIAKAWIRAVHPKKQSNNPYNGGVKARESGIAGEEGAGELTKPDWWPPGIVHREPDHIDRINRVLLLIHILRQLYDRHASPGTTISVDHLQQSTSELLKTDQEESKAPKTNATAKKAREWLDEIYYVRIQEERFIRGEIDKSCYVTVEIPIHEPKAAVLPKKRKGKARLGAKTKVKKSPSQVYKLPTASDYQNPIESDVTSTNLDVQAATLQLSSNGTSKIIKDESSEYVHESKALYPKQESLFTAQTSFSSLDSDYSQPSDLQPLISQQYLSGIFPQGYQNHLQSNVLASTPNLGFVPKATDVRCHQNLPMQPNFGSNPWLVASAIPTAPEPSYYHTLNALTSSSQYPLHHPLPAVADSGLYSAPSCPLRHNPHSIPARIRGQVVQQNNGLFFPSDMFRNPTSILHGTPENDDQGMPGGSNSSWN